MLLRSQREDSRGTLANLLATAQADYDAGRLAQAAHTSKQILALEPQHPGALYLMGRIAYADRCYAIAANYFAQAVSSAPQDASLHSALGAAYQALGRFADALLSHQQALAREPNSPMALNNLGITLVSLHRTAQAVDTFQQALGALPNDPELLNNLGAALRAGGRPAEAVPPLRRAVEVAPDFAQAHHNLGNACYDLGRLEEAVDNGQRALQLRPDFTAARVWLGVALASQGRIEEALACLREAHQQQCNDPVTHSTYLCALSYDPRLGTEALSAEHRRWGSRQVAGLPAPRHANRPEPERRLRVGYLSPDFRTHAVCYFVLPLVLSHDRRNVEVYCYSDVLRPDALTARVRASADRWGEVANLSDDQLAELIRQDQIDILGDLTGHTGRHRLRLFARKPAPVQV
ncbi:MAG TPA: tetratricopeptide repeat protein, partial [Gemmataceae bacterium]|nr:tetratricopeptide repeat protein [Gemmataceae bacterium]